jgi:hypothetical protein
LLNDQSGLALGDSTVFSWAGCHTNLHVAATTLSKAERKEFYQFLHDLKVPSGHSSNFKRLVLVKDMKMKSHDCHVLMTTLLPVALKGTRQNWFVTRSRACVYSSMQ